MDVNTINTVVGIIGGVVSIVGGVIAITRVVGPPRTKDTDQIDKPVKTRERKPPLPTPKPTNTGKQQRPVVQPLTNVKTQIVGVEECTGDDTAYRRWVEANPDGFVINSNRKISPDYLPLHRATCGFISNFDNREAGAFTERDFIKVCSTDLGLLRNWVKLNGTEDWNPGKCACLRGVDIK